MAPAGDRARHGAGPCRGVNDIGTYTQPDATADTDGVRGADTETDTQSDTPTEFDTPTDSGA